MSLSALSARGNGKRTEAQGIQSRQEFPTLLVERKGTM